MLCSEEHEIHGVRLNKCRWAHLIQSDTSQKNGIDTFAYGYRLTDAELCALLMDFLEEIQT